MAASGTSAARVVRNTLANGAGGFAGIAIGILVTPFIIRQLGLTAYGVWTLALTLTFAGGYAGLADLGLEAATARYVAEARGDDDEEAISRTVATTLLFFGLLGPAIAAIAIGLSGPLTHLFSVPDKLHDAAVLCFAIVGGQLIFEFPSRAFAAVLEGTQSFVAMQGIELTRALLQAILWAGALIAGLGIEALAAGLALSTFVALVLYGYMAHRVVPTLRAGPRHATRTEFRRLMTFGGGVFVLRFTGTLYRQMDKVILGVALTPAAVGIYEIANKIHLAAATVQSMSVSALLPAAATSRRDPSLLRDLFLRGTCYTTAVSLPVLIGIFAFAEPLIRDWIGAEAADAATPARLLLAYLLINVIWNVGSVMVVALGHLRVLLITTVVNVLINLIVSIALVRPLGVEGVILGTLAGNAAVWPVYMRLYMRTFEVDLGQLTRRVLLPNLPGTVVQIALLAGLATLIGTSGNLLVVAVSLVVSVCVSLLVFMRLGLGGSERALLLTTLRDAVLGRAPAPANP
jgi:O-antigen/teichoic acid export membrane protein